ncbi:MAG TPA: hypothetical protein VNC61_16680 [Acidimicrobiales bacterium]|nr:hypothetical protein [Acidimicrobiales bacterium]
MAALAIPVSAATVGMGASASAAAPVGCTKVTGTISGNLTFKGCGTLGKGSAPAASLASGGTITWKGKHKGTTTFSVTVTPPVQGACKSGSTEYDATGSVTADTSGKVTVGSAVSGKACVDGSGNVTLVKHTIFVL